MLLDLCSHSGLWEGGAEEGGGQWQSFFKTMLMPSAHLRPTKESLGGTWWVSLKGSLGGVDV